MIGEGFSEEVIFEQRPKAGHMTLWKKRSPGRGNISRAQDLQNHLGREKFFLIAHIFSASQTFHDG